ncbi:hypothetical protein Bbelb_328090 [Branchiostoma belcheri]|nr:hypothetical protein Bbelb_328090 [Branchiostoma belcheri]
MFHSDAPTRQHNRLDVTSNRRKNQPLFAYTMASLAKLLTRCLSLSSQVLPARGLHIPAEGSGEAGETDAGTRPAEPPPPRMLTARLQCQRNAAALDGAEDALNVHGEPTGSALKLLEAAEAFNVSQPANWCLKGKISQEYKTHHVSVWSFRNGKLVQKHGKRSTTSTPYNDGTTTSHTVQRRDNNILHRTTTGQQHLTPYNDGTTSYTVQRQDNNIDTVQQRDNNILHRTV